MNPSAIQIEKISLNINVGGSTTPDALTKASKVLEQLSGQLPRHSKSSLTVRSFGIRRNEKIAAHVTIRGDSKCKDLLKKAIKIFDNEISISKFSNTGTFGFGITEHIDLGLKYDTSIGIFGMDIDVVLKKIGKRVAKRKRNRCKVGNKQKVSKEEAIQWFVREMDGVLIE